MTPFDSLVVEVAVVNSDGSGATVWARNPLGGTPSIIAQTFPYHLMGPDLSVSQGQRLRLRFYSDDYSSGNNQTAGNDRVIRYDGTSSYASRIILTQSVTEAASTFAPPPFGARYRPHFTTPRKSYR